MLFHEHLQFGWPGFYLDYRARRTTEPNVAVNTLDELAEHGYTAFLDATPIECGRDLGLLAAIAQRTRVQIVASVGIYEQTRGFPTHLSSLSVEELVDLYSHDINEGQDGGRAGVVKVATRQPPWSQRERKAVEAAGSVSARLGVSVVTHAESVANARQQLDVMLAAGARPDRIVVGHLDSASDPPEAIVELARSGAFVGLDRFGPEREGQDERRIGLLQAFKQAGLLGSVLISHDTRLTFLGRLNVGDPSKNPFLHIERSVLPRLPEHGFSPDEIEQVLARNPWRLLQPGVPVPADKGASA